MASILELGMGFHPEFTGRENARMNAALLGLSGPEIRKRLPEIRDFAELGDFFDRPVRTYSSGMALRLAFSVATHADADVLIVDEALAVGDGYFQKKSIDRITDFQKRGGTLLFCSHALYYMALLCDNAIWLKKGSVAARGCPRCGCGPRVRTVPAGEGAGARRNGARGRWADGPNGRRPARFVDVMVHDGSGYPRVEFGAGETVSVDLSFETDDPSLAFHVRVGADREDGVQAFAVDTRSGPWAPLTGRSTYRLRLLFPELPIAQGEFRLYAFLGDETALHLHDLRVLKPGFTVLAPEYAVGMLRPRHVWSVEPDAPTFRRPPSRRREFPFPTSGASHLTTGLGFVLDTGALDIPAQETVAPEYGAWFSRLRWRRAVEPALVREVRSGQRADAAFRGADSWVVVRDPGAVPLGSGHGARSRRSGPPLPRSPPSRRRRWRGQDSTRSASSRRLPGSRRPPPPRSRPAPPCRLRPWFSGPPTLRRGEGRHRASSSPASSPRPLPCRTSSRSSCGTLRIWNAPSSRVAFPRERAVFSTRDAGRAPRPRR